MADIIYLNETELKDTPFLGEDGSSAFYRMLLARKGLSWDDVESLDPTGIKVSPKIYDIWLAKAKTDDERMKLNALLLQYGPSTDETLDENCVCVTHRAFKLKE